MNQLNERLLSLPRGLEETYERILQNLPPELASTSLVVLQWLTCSHRPLSFRELNDAQAIWTHDPIGFDRTELLPDPLDISELCSSLASVMKLNGSGKQIQSASPDNLLTISHFSVREYLLSDRIRAGPVNFYSISESTAHNNMAKACLIYLLQKSLGSGPCKSTEQMSQRLQSLPLVRYSAEFWAYHAEKALPWDSELDTLIRGFLKTESSHFVSWRQILHYLPARSSHNMRYELGFKPTAIYAASSLGLAAAVTWLLEDAVDLNTPAGLFGGTPLHAAFFREHWNIAQMLVDAGADTSIRDTNGMSPVELGAYVAKARFGPSVESKIDEATTSGDAEACQRILRIAHEEIARETEADRAKRQAEIDARRKFLNRGLRRTRSVEYWTTRTTGPINPS